MCFSECQCQAQEEGSKEEVTSSSGAGEDDGRVIPRVCEFVLGVVERGAKEEVGNLGQLSG